MSLTKVNEATTVDSNYTNLHLSAIAFVYPPTPPTVAQCKCEVQPSFQEGNNDQKHIRVYRNEPSGYGYNSGCYLIKESRFSTLNGWHAPIDDLVADDAAPGSPVAAIGWWEKSSDNHVHDNSYGSGEVWQTRIYYISNDGMIRERWNRSHFAPIVKEDIDSELPKPEELVEPTPGWKLTALRDSRESKDKGAVDVTSLPKVFPFANTKLAAAHSDDGSIHVIYQAKDKSIRELVFFADKGWTGQAGGDNDVVLGAATAKPGTPLTVVAGGWSELRVFCVNTASQLLQIYSDDHVEWDTSLTPYTVEPTAMLAAVARNFASAFFEIRVYTAADNDDLHEFSFSRRKGGWGPDFQGISSIKPDKLPAVVTPLSAVAAALVPGEWTTKVYFHPRRIVVAEWDICSRDAAHAGVTRLSAGAKMRRAIEEETRAKIAEEAKRREEEKKRKEEEERKRIEEIARKKKVEQERARQAKAFRNVSKGGTAEITDPVKLQNVQKIMNCSSGYKFVKIEGGWQCTGGGHSITDAQFDAA